MERRNIFESFEERKEYIRKEYLEYKQKEDPTEYDRIRLQILSRII